MTVACDTLLEAIAAAPMVRRLGQVASYNGLVIEALGPEVGVGELCHIDRDGRAPILAEVVGFRQGRTQLMPFGEIDGLAPGQEIRACERALEVPVGDALLGRVVNALCEPIDGRPLQCAQRYALRRTPINPLHRAPIDTPLATGIRAVDTLLTLGEGQRIGVFAGSGVGKSTLLGALAREVQADVTVLALIGERGREVGDFLRHSLGDTGLRRSVVMVATADETAVTRVHAAHAAHAVAEYFRDSGRSVLLVVDSMTRFAMAQREIGLAVGEPPTFRGYTPSVFAQLPRMLERCGKLQAGGSITGIYSVLVEGDDMNEPVTDHMRAILDGHVVLSRDLAARGHHPAIDVLHSASRVMDAVASSDELALAREARRHLALYEASRDLIELGAHQKGANPALDRVIEQRPHLEAVLQQPPSEATPREAAYRRLAAALQGAA